MTWANYDDAILQLENAGLIIDSQRLTIDSRIQRWPVRDGKGNEKPGWTKLKEWQS